NSILFFVLNSIFALGSFSYSFLLLFANKFGFEIIFIPVLYLIYTAVASIVSLPFGKLADKIGRKNVMFISFVCWALVCLSFLLLQEYVAIIITFVLYGLHKGALEPVQKTLVSELAPAEYRASFLGTFQMVIGLCALPSSLIAGLLWDKIGVFTSFYFSLGLTIVAILLLIFVKEIKYAKK
ncbi:MAG: MFS transporter, partial [Ignavibacteriales bacterium]|nr:MFS transporter [Ignavibacteriales bacterium]